MYYFHSRNVPESDKADGVKVGLESVIKIFYRPANLRCSKKKHLKASKLKVPPMALR
ncbi:hypothetical protein AB6F55_06675 [Providencia hangzhouensis]